MFFRKIKVLFFSFTFITFLLLMFSDIFISDIIHINRKIVLSFENEEVMKLPINFWNNLTDKAEFVYKGHFYDVKSFEKTNNIVIVTAYKDKAEIILKTLKKTLHSKNKKNTLISSKKYLNLYFPSTHESFVNYNFVVISDNYSNFEIAKNLHSFSVFHPPC